VAALTAVLLRARAEVRSHLTAWVALAVVAGLGAGIVMTAAAGGRRTDSSYRRFLTAQKGDDLFVWSAGRDSPSVPFDQVRALPQVATSAQVYALQASEPFNVIAGDPAYLTKMDRPKVLHGRMPRGVDETAIDFFLAATNHLHVGGRLPVHYVLASDTTTPGANVPVLSSSLRVVGIEASPGEFPPQLGTNSQGTAHITLATVHALEHQVAVQTALVLRLHRGSADVPAFNGELQGLVQGGPSFNTPSAQQAANVNRSIHLQAVALWLVGALFGIVALAVLGQLLARQATVDADEHPTLRALGMTRSQLWGAGMLRAFLMALVAAGIGLVIAVVASPLTPIGTARVAEPHPGLFLDPLVLPAGVAGTVLLMCALAAWPLWRATAAPERGKQARPAAERPSLLARAARPLRPPGAAGVRMALEPGRGRTAVPVRSSLLAVTVAVAALVAAVTFAASLDHLLATPRLYGWSWDARVTSNSSSGDAESVFAVLGADKRIADVATLDNPPLDVGGAQIDDIAMTQVRGSIQPVVLEGRLPHGDQEVALGTDTMRKTHTRVGGTVPIRITAIPPYPQRFRVVGRVVIPPLSDTARLGSGALMDTSAELRMVPPAFKDQVHPSEVELKFAPGVDHARAVADLSHRLGPGYLVLTPTRPADLVNFGRVQNLPVALAGILALLGAATLAQTLISSIGKRRRDLSILKTLGFSPGQVRWTVVWQTSTFVAAAMVIGIPLGVAAGRLAWTAFAERLGTLAVPIEPPLLIVLLIPGVILVANLIAAVPGALAGRIRPALVLRTE
jgi:hypothetical protein